MKSPVLVFALTLVGAAQLALPGWKVYHQLDLLENAPRFLCRARPVDPVDPLRGRYVALDLSGLDALPLERESGERGDRTKGEAYLALREGEDGFARYRLQHDRPEGDAWIRVRYVRSGETARVLLRSQPFSRYYLEETRAPRAEEAYRRAARASQAWIALRVRAGDAALEELYVDGQPIGAWLAARADDSGDSVAPADERRPDLPE